MKHLLHPEADEEFSASIHYYSEISPDLGARFYREMERLLREVCEQPERFWQFDPPARRHLSDSFPYAIIYLEKPEVIWIIAVMHMKRRPGYWRGRLA